MEGVSVEEIQGRGRSVISSQPLKAGQIILRDSPLLLYSAHPFSAPPPHHRRYYYCSHCFRTISPHQSPVATCPTCKNESSETLFCDPNCQLAAAATSHTPWVCNALLRVGPSLSLQPEELQVQARFLIAAYNLAFVSPEKFEILLSLHGGGDGVGENGVLLHSALTSLCPPPQAKIGSCLELTTALLVKDKLNAFGLMEPFSEDNRLVRAYGIYPNGSLFNHDCLPNACRFDYVDSADVANTDIVIRTIHDVPEGREICLSYFPVNLNYRERQLRLKDDYGFVCSCDRCQIEANWSESDDENNGGVEEGDDDVAMDEDDDENDEVMEAGEDATENGNDFPHAYFFLRYMCTRENCWGTLAPLPTQPSAIGTISNSSSGVIMECNVCGNLKNDEIETSVDAGLP